MERIAIELVLPGRKRLLLVGRKDGSEAGGVLTVRLEPAPSNSPDVLAALTQLAPEPELSTGQFSDIPLPPPHRPAVGDSSIEINLEEEIGDALDSMFSSQEENSGEKASLREVRVTRGGAAASSARVTIGEEIDVRSALSDQDPHSMAGDRSGIASALPPLAASTGSQVETELRSASPGGVGIESDSERVGGSESHSSGSYSVSSMNGQVVAGPARSPHPERLRRESEPSIPAVGDQKAPKPKPKPRDRAVPKRRPRRKAPSAGKKWSGKNPPMVGIDFGTSYTCVGILRAGLELIPGPDGNVLMPSVVSFPAPGEVIIGTEARRRMAGEAQWTISSPKRLLARPYKDPMVGSFLGTLAMRTFAGTDKFIRFEAHRQIYSVTDICAMILAELRERAEKYLEVPVRKAIFAVPVAYGSLQRTALEQAARQAGLQVGGMLTEPSAALLAHGFRGKAGMVAVYDFGGGTFDFCVVEVSATSFRVICAGGDPWLGGDDFDTKFASVVADKFWKEHGVDVRNRAVEWQRLLFAVERTKRKLSDSTAAPVHVPKLISTLEGEKSLEYTVSRVQFDQIVAELVAQSISVAKRVMEQGGVVPEQIDTVVMTGGTSLIPCVREAVTRFFGKEPMVGDSELAVVRGAALRAAELSGQSTASTSAGGRQLMEVAGRTIAISVDGADIDLLFERSTPLPAEVRKTFHTTRDNQTELGVVLYEVPTTKVDRRQVLGQLRYRGLEPGPAGGSKVDLVFHLDKDGVLHVSANIGGHVVERTIRVAQGRKSQTYG